MSENADLPHEKKTTHESALSRMTLGAVAFGTVGLIVAFLRLYPDADPPLHPGTYGVTAALGMAIGAVFAALAGNLQFTGRLRATTIGVLAGTVVGLAGGVAFGEIRASCDMPTGQISSKVAGYIAAESRHRGLCTGLPLGALLGGISGCLVTSRRKGA
jgi:hypothetical protein